MCVCVAGRKRRIRNQIGQKTAQPEKKTAPGELQERRAEWGEERE